MNSTNTHAMSILNKDLYHT